MTDEAATPTTPETATPPANGNGNGSKYEKSHLQSKKFVAYLVAEVLWKAVMVLLIVTWTEGWAMGVMLTVVIVAGFIEATFIGGQAALDKYVRVAEITMEGQKNIAVFKNGHGPKDDEQAD